MLIGELSKLSGLSRDTIRFYEKNGLIAVGKKERRFNNYKEYSDDMLKRLLSIKQLKGLGFTLNEIADLLDMLDVSEATCKNVSHKIDGKVLFINQKINELKAIRKQLLDGKKNCEDESGSLKTPDKTCPVFVV
ncbi:MerR family transcriptional regulator [Parapedobacter sp. 10938]|uniref:MerR family transcriptional regulator n=1 Tax=Parapedobacter flavus TaxID=3110225 RepID=UPI002DB6AC6C|nr:MerR family transcriptional regulator [Parapedobacter sp. 10938]MEC3880245.1 MerR family transcriptional regulator [Parapedobacter sp. 10938]